MDNNGYRRLEDIKNNVNNIIKDLDEIASGLNRDFDNVGNDICAAKIWSVKDRFMSVKRMLDNIDTSNVEK